MRNKPFARTGVDLPVIGQGTWDVPESGARLVQGKAALLRGIELGMTHVDTAEMYGSGRVEEIVGETIAGVPREKLFLTTKVLPGNASYEGALAAADRSLRRLRVDYVDLYLLHWPSEHPLEETMRALEALATQGKTRYVGVSNFDAAEMLEAAGYLRDVPLTCNQVLYHVRERGAERGVIPTANERGIAVVAYTPFGRGRFPRRESEPGGVLDAVARKHGATPRQVILAFLTREPNVFTIPKAASVPHVEENAGASDVVLDAGDVDAIDAAFPLGRPGPLATL
ncbi:MAG TPA: aldo/keto reductase [Candidatus Baltobacteraceae bacterium]|jgi:diketogulonate reductase-like aldo/keto reductase|nr:aldo/keto reductase [Candidatus Baltobacteraceae bacterium]